MSHYDLYSALGLDRSADSPALAAAIDRMIASTGASGDARLAELHTARTVLGDSHRRALYDGQLDNPAAPEITVDAVHELASMPVAEPTAYPGETTVIPIEGRAGTRQPRPYWLLPGVASVVILALAAVLITMIFSGSGDHDDGATTDASVPAMTSTGGAGAESENPTATPTSPGVASSGPDHKPTPKETPTPDVSPAESSPPLGENGYGLKIRQPCGTSSDVYGRYFAGTEGTASCALVVNAGSHLTGREALPYGSTTSFDAVGQQGTDNRLDCRAARDGNNPPRPVWKCTVRASGSTLYVFP